MLQLYEVVTTEHTTATGETIYLTKFGGID